MTVNPGFHHQHFRRSALPKVRRVREMIERGKPGCELELDGRVDLETAPLGVAAGTNLLEAGRSLFGDDQEVAVAIPMN